MLFGSRENPKVISWGNPGAPFGDKFENAVLAAGRRTEGGKYQRKHPPVITAATADYRIEPMRVDDATLNAMTFKSMSMSDGRDTVYAVDENGRIQTWGDNPAGIGDSIATSDFGLRHFRYPVPVTTVDDRASNAHVVKFKKVESFSSFDSLYSFNGVIALSTAGVLYATGPLNLDNRNTPTTARHNQLRQVSTQTWISFAVLPGTPNAIVAVRDDNTLWTTGPLRSTSSSHSNQIKGSISAIYLSGAFTQSTNKSNALSFTLSSPEAGGRKPVFTIQRDTSTSSYYVKTISNAGLYYTSEPSITFFGLESANNTPLVTFELLPEKGWVQVESNQGTFVALNNTNSTSKVFVSVDAFDRPSDLAPSGISDQYAEDGLYEIRHMPGAPNHNFNPYIGVRSVHMAKGYFASATPNRTPSSLFMLQHDINTSRSNMLALGDNQYSQLGFTSANSIVRTPTEVPSPDNVDFSVRSVASGRINTLVVREGSNVPGFDGVDVQHLYAAGRSEFSGATTAASNITAFASVQGVNNTSSKWEHVFSFGDSGFSPRFSTAVVNFASYSTNASGFLLDG